MGRPFGPLNTGMVSAGTRHTFRKEGVRGGTRGSPAIRKAPRCGSGGFVIFAGLFLRGDDPEALALRPSHYLRAICRRLWRAPCIP